jgi:uncharacterized protein involved in type VI secretion and phage assembly
MPETMIDTLSKTEQGQPSSGFAIAPGVVVNNIDSLGEGRVQVKITARPSFQPWARLPSIGGASGRGFMWVPQIDDEVLVAFADNDTSSAYILGGLWSTMHSPPIPDFAEMLTKRVIRTGLTEALGHQIEFDDAEQSITITTSTDQKISMDPQSIELTNLAGTVSITLDNDEQKVSITAANEIELTAVQISMSATKIDMSGTDITITAAGPCTVQGLPIQLN